MSWGMVITCCHYDLPFTGGYGWLMLSPYFLNLIHGARMTIQPWTAWDFLPEMSENNTLKNTIRMQKFPFELLPYNIYIFIGLIQNIWVHIWCLTSRGNASYVLKKSLPYIDKLDICESLQHLKAWRFPEPFLCGGSRRVPASLVFDYPSVAELVDRGRVGMILLAIRDYTTWFIYWGLW